MNILILCVFFFSSFINSKAQLLSKDAFSVNKGVTFGIIGGGIDINKENHRGGGGFNLTIYGGYIDIWGWPGGSHKHDVEVKKWTEETCKAIHIGYQIPLFKRFRIIPVMGFTQTGYEHTDGSDWTVSNGNINNSSFSDEGKAKFDFGGVAVIKIWKHTNINIGYTKHCLYGGISWGK